MKQKKEIVVCFLLLSLLVFTAVTHADLVFDEEELGGTFTQTIVQNARVTVGDIPVGVAGLSVELNCEADVDIELWDLDDGNFAVIAYEIGLKQSAVPITFDYKGMSITYSGWDGIDDALGHETIAISGTTTANLRIIAFGYAPGTATVNYTYTEYVPVDTGYDLTYTAGPHGSISGEANQSVNHAGMGTAVTAVPDAGYHFLSWSDGVTTATRTDSNVLADIAVTANFAINSYTLTYAAGEHGSIGGDAEQHVNHGSSGSMVTAQPAPGYYFVNWSDGNTSVARTDSNVAGDINLVANFAPKLAITVTADGQNKVYGNADPTLTYRITTGSLEPGDSFDGLLVRALGENVGSYQIDQGTLTAGAKYQITFVPANLNIMQRSLQVTADSQQKTYGDADPPLTYSITQGSLRTGDVLAGSLARAIGENTGNYQIGQGSLTGGGNYQLEFLPASLHINAKAIGVVADVLSKHYGDADQPLTYRVTGLVGGDALSGSLSRVVGEAVGSYAINQGDLTASGNYVLDFTPATFTISARLLTVTAANVNRVYDGQPYSGFSVTYDNFAPTENQAVLSGALSFSGNAVAAVNAGTYEIIPAGLESGNYAITFVSGEFSIAKRALTVTADAKSKVYDGAAFTAFSASYSGFAGSDDEHDLAGPLVYGGSAATETNAGTYAIVLAGLTSDNYNITFVNGELTITKRQLVATAGNYNKIYGSDNPGFIVDVTGFIPGEDAGTAAGYSAPTASCGATATTGVGTAEVAVSGGSADNYSFQRVPGTLTINRRELTPTAVATGKIYDGTIAASGNIHLSGIVNEDDVTATGTFRFTDPNAGPGKAVQATDITLAGDKAGNYTLASTGANSTADVSKADISGVGFLDASLDYDGYAHELVITGELPDGASVSYSSNVGTGAGTYLARAEISGGQNYNDLTLNATLQIRKAPLTVTVDDASKTYGETNPGFVLHVTGFAREESEASAAGYRAPTAECVAGETTAVGTVPITISAGLADNYSFDVSHQGTLTIVKKELTAKAVDCSKIYGSGNPEFAVEVTGFILGENAGNAAGYSAPTAACTATDATDVGTVEIELSGGSATNYSFNNINGVLTINRKPLTATATAEDKVYDGSAAAEGEVQLAGIVGGDAVTANGSFAFANAEAGTGKQVNVSGILLNGLKKDNYTVNTTAVAEADINPKPLTAVIQVDDKFYDGNDTAVGRIGLQGVVGDDDVEAGGSFRFADRNVGTGIAVAVSGITLSGEKAANYTMANAASGSASINPRPITVTADTLSKVYGEADPALSYRVTAGTLVDGDAISGSLARQSGESAGNYTIEGALSAGDNYQLSYVPAQLTIQRRPLTVTADVQSKVYGDADPELTYAVTTGSLVGGDAFQGSLTRDAGEDVDRYAIQQGTLTAGSNYELTYVSKDLTISQRPITVTAEAKTKVYGEADPALTYQITLGELVSGDAISGSLARQPGESAGNYTIEGALSAGDNYQLSYVPAQFTIQRRPLTVTADVQSKVYGDADPEFTCAVTAGSLVGGDALQGSLTRDPGEDVDGYAIQQGTLTAGSNYELTYVSKDLTISQRPITVTAETKTKVYGEADPALSYRVTAGTMVDGDAISGGLTRQPGEGTGSYTIEGALSAGDNYQLNYVPAQFIIQRRPLTVTADVQSKVYGDADPEFTCAVTAGSLVGSDALQGSLTRDAGEGVDRYAIQQGTLTAGSNYDLTYVSKDLTISQRPITVTAEAKTKVYGEADPALTYLITLGELVGGDAFSGGLARADGTSVRTYEILQGTLTAGNNYALTYVSADLEITRKEISAAGIAARSKYWDGAAAASLDTSNTSLVGVEPGDDVQLDVSRASGAFADANLGANKQVTVTGLALVGDDAGNYLLNTYTTTASIVDEPEPPAPPKPPTPPTPPADNGGVVIIVNGEVQEQSATATTTVVEGKTITTVTIDPQKLAERLEQEGENSTVTVPVNTGADVVTGTLTGQSVKQMEAKSSVLEIRTENVTYTLPAAQINIDAVAEQIGGNVSLQDVNVRVQVAAPAADTARVVEDTANRNNYQVVVKPVEFSVICEHAGRVVEVSRFNAYVERMVAVPDGVDPSKITTGIVLNADGTFSHVPTTIVMIDGKYYAKINSLTNSVYSVIWNPIEFQDMVGHWAKGPVNDMGSRLVMEGDSSELFGPNRAITRGEFAATIVKALGLRPATGDSPFVDLHAGDQYYGHILTAYQYGIMNGLPGNKFGAGTELTRQEAMAIVVSAMRLTELSSTLSSAEVNAALATYADSARVGGWARNVVAACLKSGIIGGRPGQLIAPQEMITRAEAAAIMQRFLRQSGLI